MRRESLDQLIRDRMNEGAELRHEFARTSAERVQEAATIAECLRAGNKVLKVGNGGSATDAQHLSAELIGRFGEERARLPAVALTADSSALTEIENDCGFGEVFARQVQALAEDGELVFVTSTGGRSRDLMNAARAARLAGVKTIALTRGHEGELSAYVDIGIVGTDTRGACRRGTHPVRIGRTALFPGG
jgi:D-sedoheptulose 7-phosphate isomerase